MNENYRKRGAEAVGFRHEIKILLKYAEYLALRPRLSGIMPPDENAGENGEYFIRSLYFDDMSKTSYFEKLAGVADRKKYRLRIYGGSDSVIKLECKEKKGDRIRKRSAQVSRDCAEKLCAGDFSGLEGSDDPLLNEILSVHTSRGLKPSVIVDYDREAYIHPVSNVRLTFDKALHTGIESYDIFDKNMLTAPVFPSGEVIFEVKYDDILPKHLQMLISGACGSRLALSKSTLCQDILKNYRG